MIDSVTIPIREFDLEGFIRGYSEFTFLWSGEESLVFFVTGIRKYGEIPGNFLAEDDTDEQRSIREALMKGLKVFFAMHEPAADDRFLCIDGKRRKTEDLDLNLEDSYGFLVEVDGDLISLHPALYDGTSGRPSLTVQGTCSVLEEPMNDFVGKWVKG